MKISVILIPILLLITLQQSSSDAATNPNFNFTIDGKLYNSSSLTLNQSTVQGDVVFLNATDSQNHNSTVLFKDAIALFQNSSLSETNSTTRTNNGSKISSFSTEFTISVDLTDPSAIADLVFAMSPVSDLELAYNNRSDLQGNLGFELLFTTGLMMTGGSLQEQRYISFEPQGYAYGVEEFDFINSDVTAMVANLSSPSLHSQLCETSINSSSYSTDETLTLIMQVSALYNSTTDDLQLGFTTCTGSVLQALLPSPWLNLAASMAAVTSLGNSTNKTTMTYLGFLATSGKFNVSTWRFEIDPSSTPDALNSSHYTSVQYYQSPGYGDYGGDNYGPGIGMFHYRRRPGSGGNSSAYVIGFSVAAAAAVILAAAIVAVVICRRRYRAKRITSRQIHAVPDRRPGSDEAGGTAGSVAMQTLAASAPSSLTATSDNVPLNPVISRSPSFSEMASGWLRPVAPR